MRDEFPERVKQELAKRVGLRCSNPNCRKQTSGPHAEDERSVNIGVAAHITAATSGGPRFDPVLSSEERSAIGNAIWLCQVCAKLVDSDMTRFSAATLVRWKRRAEHSALQAIGGAEQEEVYPSSIARAHTPIPKIHGLDYEVARAKLIEAGWQPAMHHWNHGEKADLAYGGGKTFWDKGYCEIVAASGTGLAHMWFRYRDVYGNELIVMTAGEVDPEGRGAGVWRWYFDPDIAGPESGGRKFVGEIGHLDKARSFIDFMCRNVGHHVWIDVFISEAEFRGAYTGEHQWLTLYDELWGERTVGQDFGYTNATGVAFNFKAVPSSADCYFYLMRGFVKLRGHFAVLGMEGPNQGLMSILLKPLHAEDAGKD